MRFLSLFSGIEAASVAWYPLGWECVGVAEIEPFPCKVLAHHYPNVPNLGSVTEITKEQIERLGHIDLVVGGFPCQDLSIAGKRKGLRNDDGSPTRSGLFYTAMQIVEWANPRWTLIENVPGLFSSRNGADFASVVGEMAGCEFSVPRDGWRNSGCAVGRIGLVEWVTLDAQYCRTPLYPRAVPQRRRRVFVVRDSGNWQGRKPLFFDEESLRGNPPPSREKGKEVAGTISKGSFTGGAGGRPEGAAGNHFISTSKEYGGEGGLPLPEMRGGELGNMVADVRMVRTGASVGASGNYFIPSGTCSGKQTFGTLMANCGEKQWLGNQEALSGDYHVFALAGNTIDRKPENGGNGAGFDGSGTSYTLTKVDRHAVDYSFDSMSSNSMKSSNPDSGCNEVEVAKCLDTSRGLDPTCNQGGMAVAFQQNTRDAGALSASPGMKQQNYIAFGVGEKPEVAHCLRSGASKADKHESTTYVAAQAFNPVSATLKGSGKGSGTPDPSDGNGHSLVSAYRTNAAGQINDQEGIAAALNTQTDPCAQILHQDMSVRRLTPTECARLQGFSDSYLSQVPGASDTQMYRALGNSMAVNVMQLLGQRIQMVDDL